MEGYVLPPTFAYDVHKQCHKRCRSTCNQQGQHPLYEDRNAGERRRPTSRDIGELPEEIYVQKVLKFLSEFSWIYDFQLTHLLTGSTLKLIPAEWSHFLTSLTFSDLNELPSNPNMVNIPTSLRDFIGTCQELSLPRDVHDNIPPVQLSLSVTKGMNPKKRHEVSKMAAVVTDLSLRSNCPLVVDVGAGLGYLSAVIARHSKLRVLALECREMLTHGTEARGLDQGLAENLDALTYNLQDNEDNFQELRSILLEKLQSCTRSNGSYSLHDSMPSTVPGGKNARDRAPSQLAHCADNNLGISETDRRSCRSQHLDLPLGNLTTFSSVTIGVTQEYGSAILGGMDQGCGHISSQEDKDIANAPCTLEKNHVALACPSASQTGHDTSRLTKNTPGCIDNSSSGVLIAGTSGMCTESSTGSDAGLRTSESSTESIPELTGCSVDDPGISMIGLHCCGSLTPTMMKLFKSTPEIHSMVCVSCCYHSLQQTGDKTWAHFPMSQGVKNMMESKLPNFNISVFGMRLAAQETRARWASQSETDHTFHRNNVGFRALLQLVCQQEGITIEKEKRHLANKKDMASFDTYISAVLQRSNLGKQCPELGDKLRESYMEHRGTFDLIEPFTGLQVALQPVLESLILIDRILYLREAGTEATLVPIFQDSISPRNIAILAEKRELLRESTRQSKTMTGQ